MSYAPSCPGSSRTVSRSYPSTLALLPCPGERYGEVGLPARARDDRSHFRADPQAERDADLIWALGERTQPVDDRSKRRRHVVEGILERLTRLDDDLLAP